MMKSESIVPELIESRIYLIQGHKVLLDFHLAELYAVETRKLIQAVKRNIDRFPPDFMFQLSKDEFHNLRSQFVTSRQWGGRRYRPFAFTEQGVAMLSSVLRSKRAIQAIQPIGKVNQRRGRYERRENDCRRNHRATDFPHS